MTIIDNSQRQRFDINRAPDVHVGRVSRNTVVYDVRDSRLERVSEIPERLDQRGGTRGQSFLSDLGRLSQESGLIASKSALRSGSTLNREPATWRKCFENTNAPSPEAVLAFVRDEYASFQVLSYGVIHLGICRAQPQKGAGACSSSTVLIWSTVIQRAREDKERKRTTLEARELEEAEKPKKMSGFFGRGR